MAAVKLGGSQSSLCGLGKGVVRFLRTFTISEALDLSFQLYQPHCRLCGQRQVSVHVCACVCVPSCCYCCDGTMMSWRGAVMLYRCDCLFIVTSNFQHKDQVVSVWVYVQSLCVCVCVCRWVGG